MNSGKAAGAIAAAWGIETRLHSRPTRSINRDPGTPDKVGISPRRSQKGGSVAVNYDKLGG